MKIRCPVCNDAVDTIMLYSHRSPDVMCMRCAGQRYAQDRGREMIADDIGVEDPDCEWWVLVGPKDDTWMRVTETEARDYPVVECRMKHAITFAQLESLYK